MESRMMLSATGFEAPQPVPVWTQSTLVPAQISFTGAYVSLGPSSPDGGLTISNLETDVQFGSTSSSNAFTSSNVTDLRFNSVVLSSAPLQSRALQVYDSPLLSGTGLKPEVFAAAPSSGALETNLQPVVLGPSPSTPGVSEGGSIPIHAIFADFRKDSQLASGVKPIASSAAETSVASLASERQLSTPDKAIAGEWARAMVFEIAGGEPTASDLHAADPNSTTTSDTDQSLQHAQPLSSIETSDQNAKFSSQHAARTTNEVSPPGEPAEPFQTTGQVASVAMQLLGDNNLTAGTSAPATIGQFSAGNPSEVTSPDATAVAANAVFEQLGKENSTNIDRPVDGKWWVRSIAALNSRRETRDPRSQQRNRPFSYHSQ
jgi:hypothetical protein